METSNIILSVILTSFCLLPVVLIYFNRKKTARILKDKLYGLATELKCEIQEFERSQDIMIGIDRTNNFLFFVRRKVNEYSKEYIDLNGMKSCKVLNHYKPTPGVDKKIEKLDLEFEPKLSSQQKKVITFYDEDECFALNGEVPLINKWSQILNLEMGKAL